MAAHLALVLLAARAEKPSVAVSGVARTHAPASDRSIELDLVAIESEAPPSRAAPATPSARSPSSARRPMPAARTAPATSSAGPGSVVTDPGGESVVHEPPAPRGPRAGELLRATAEAVQRLGASELGPSVADADGDVRRALDGYFQASSAGARHDQIPGASAYYRPLRQTLERAWRPQSARTVSLSEGIVGSVLTGPEGFRRVAEAMEGSLAPTRRSAALIAGEAAHPNSPMLTTPAHPTARAEATARTTRAVLEVDQDASSRLVSLRVVESSGVALFDASAREAIAAAIEAQEPRSMPGGWRSRWLFEVTYTRTPPPLGFLPGLPDEAPRVGVTVGGTFDETTGEVRAAVPFALNERRVVRLLWSAARELPDGGGA